MTMLKALATMIPPKQIPAEVVLPVSRYAYQTDGNGQDVESTTCPAAAPRH